MADKINDPGETGLKDSIVVKLIRPFRSIRFAFILILILASFSLIGAILPQAPAEFTSSPAGYSWWLNNVAYDRFVFWTDLFGFFGFFKVFHSFWFITVVVLLLFNIAVCTVSRFSRLKGKLLSTDPLKSQDFYRQGRYKTENPEIRLPQKKISSAIEKILRLYKYNLHKKEKDGIIYFSGDKHRYSVFGTYAVHLSLFLFVAGFLLTTYLGFQDTSFVIAENTVREVGHNTKLSLYLESFTDQYWEDGTPKDYSSKVAVLENGREVKNGIIRVNHPLYYRGIRFHQAFFGPAVRMKVSGPDGNIIFEGSVPLPEYRITNTYQRPQGGLKLDGTEYFVAVLENAVNGEDPSIGNDEVGLELYGKDMAPITWAKLVKGRTQEIEDMEFTFIDKADYSGLQISRDPGITFIWIASFLFIVGLGAVFYFPRRQVWMAIYPVSTVWSELLIRMIPMKGLGSETEFEKITTELGKELNSNKEN